jgi:hypothetical protein
MARKRKRRSRGTARVPIPDEELIAKLQHDAPEVLTASVPEAAFDTVVQRLLEESPGITENPHFYCRKCREYHLKTHPHYTLTKESKSPPKQDETNDEENQ